MSLFACGDTHGDIDFHKLNSKNFNCDGLTKDDFVLICGDFGGVWDNSKEDKYIQNWYNNKPWTTLFVDGNHENHAVLDSLPVEYWNGGYIHRISDSIIHLMRGQIYNIDGYKIFTMGGASSHDKIYRKENVSWWSRELPSDEEYNIALTNLELNNNVVDYIFSHCISTDIQNQIRDWYEKDKLTNFFNTLQDVSFKQWFCGHYHIDKQINNKYTILYNDIKKVW